MRRCIRLAKNSKAIASPNPMVGCVIVLEDKVIGEGFTSAFGGPHAEVNAINSVEDKSLLAKATLYVSLEPCSHFGKTPPCSDLIVKYNIPKVVVGIRDPHTLVAGGGIQKLRQAGCEVEEGVLEDECKEVNLKFFVYHQHKRPYIILKWAQSADGYLAPLPNQRKDQPEPYWITNSHSRQLVHKWRTEEQAVLIGTNTALEDNPRLTTRDWHGSSPVRVVLDKDLKIPSDYHVLDNNSKTLVLTASTDKSKKKEGIHYMKIDFEGDLVEQICQILWKNQFLSVIVEGGAQTLESFINKSLWDEARIFIGPVSFSSGLKAPAVQGRHIHEQNIGTDQLKIIRHD